MARPKKKPNYDPNKIMNELLDIVIDAYDKSFAVNSEQGELKMVASELERYYCQDARVQGFKISDRDR